jgi:hypothetical protein
MRVPQVSDRIKEAPAQALRGVFAGIGQLLLITDKLRNKTPADQHVPHARAPKPAESVAQARGTPAVPEQAPAPAAPAATAGAAEADVTVGADVTEVPPARQPAGRKPAGEKTARGKATREKTAAPKTAEPKTAGQKAPEPEAAPWPPAPRTPRTLRTPAEKATETRDFDKTGNVRLLPDTGGAAKAASAQADATIPAVQPASEPPPAVGEPPAAAGAEEVTGAMEAAGPAAGARAVEAGAVEAGTVEAGTLEAGTVEAGTVEAGTVEPPLPNYGELSIASLRARLRNLDIGQVRQLAEYEKGHAGRTDVIAMFERRIAKLEAGE